MEKSQIANQLPNELWLEIFGSLSVYDIILFRSSCKGLRTLCKRMKLLGPYFALNHQKCVEYFALLGSVSCLEYLLSLGVEIDFSNLADLVAEHGKTQQHVEVLKFCEKKGSKSDKIDLAKKCMKSQCNFTMLTYLCETIRPKTGYFEPKLQPEDAASRGHYRCMKLLLKTGFDFYSNYRGIGIAYTPSAECLQYYLSRQHYWKDDFIANAAADGKLKLIKFAQEHNATNSAPYNELKTVECAEYLLHTYGTPKDGRYCLTAIEKNNLEVVQFFIEKGLLPFVSGEMIIRALGASKEMYELLINAPGARDTGQYPIPTDLEIPIQPYPQFGLKSPFVEFIIKNDVKTFDFLVKKWPLSQEQYQNCFLLAIYCTKDFGEDDEIPMVKYLGQKFPFQTTLSTRLAMNQAARFGCLKTLQYLAEKSVPWNSSHLLAASRGKNFEALVYLDKIGCKWIPDVCDYAGNLLCLKYAREHGCSWTELLYDNLFANLQYSEMKDRARVERNVDIPMLRYAVSHGCPMRHHTRDDINFLARHHPSLNIRGNK